MRRKVTLLDPVFTLNIGIHTVPKKTSGFYGSYRNEKTREKESTYGQLLFPVGLRSMAVAFCSVATTPSFKGTLPQTSISFFFSSLIYWASLRFSLIARKPLQTQGATNFRIFLHLWYHPTTFCTPGNRKKLLGFSDFFLKNRRWLLEKSKLPEIQRNSTELYHRTKQRSHRWNQPTISRPPQNNFSA